MEERDPNTQHREDIEIVNSAEEWLVRARRLGKLIGKRVQAAIDLDGPPVLRAPHVQLDGERMEGAEPEATG